MVDETHHVGEDGQFDRLLSELSAALQFGVTATPWRADQYDIEMRFGAASYKLGIEEGMRRGYLFSSTTLTGTLSGRQAKTAIRSRNSTASCF